MAPINPDLQNVQEDIKNVIQDLFQVLVQVSNYDAAGRPTRDVLAQDIQTLDKTLLTLHTNALSLPATPSTSTSTSTSGNPSTTTTTNRDKPIPEPLIHYVENGRNPDIYTREFAELVRRMNQLARGKMHAFRDFRDVLAREMAGALPELRADVDLVVGATGGVTETEAGAGTGIGAGAGTGTGMEEGGSEGGGNGGVAAAVAGQGSS